MNSFISVLNPGGGSECPFCGNRETVFHAFMNCIRLKPLFAVLHHLFHILNEKFSMDIFILGYGYSQKHKAKRQLVNVIISQAKRAIYMSHKNRIENVSGYNVFLVYATLVKSCVLIHCCFYKEMNELTTFRNIIYMVP